MSGNGTSAVLLAEHMSMTSPPLPKVIEDFPLAATSTAVSCALLFVDHTLRRWSLLDLLHPVGLVVTELVDNAVQLTGIPDPSPRWSELTDLAMIRLRLVLIEDGVIVEVADRHSQPPVLSDGLRSICSRYRSYPTHTGRMVWCEVSTRPVELTPAGLPKRQPSPGPRTTRPLKEL
jgi:hypothetical protein